MKKYVMIFEETEKDGDCMVRSHGTNEGFSALEVLGILEWKRNDVLRQLNGEIKPENVTRQIIKPEQDGGAE